MKKQKDAYNQELVKLIESLENLLKGQDTFKSNEELNNILSQIHQIVETANQYGIINIANLFSPIEEGVSEIIESKGAIDKHKNAVIISSINISNAIFNDPTLSDTNLKSTYKNILKQIEDTFSQSEEDKEDNVFSNNRFQEIFIEEANDLINQLEEKLLQLEGEPDDLTLIDNVFRIMHTLKGNSNMFGFVHLGDITHQLENIYDAIRSHKLDINREILNITLQCVDHFRNLIDDPELSDNVNQDIQKGMLTDIEDILSTPAQLDTINEDKTKEGGINTFYIHFKPDLDVFDDGTNPLFYVSDLNELGQCIVQPIISDIPDEKTYNPEKCYIGWHILLATEESKETILDYFMFLNSSSQPSISKITRNNVIDNPDYIEKLKEGAEIKGTIIDKFGISIRNSRQERQGTTDENRKVKTKSTDSAIASVRVASAKVDLMMNLISELVTKQAELSMISSENDIPQLQEVAESIESISRDLRDNAFSISLIPLEKSVLRFQRLVRDVSNKFNKKVDFIVEGKETELDKTIIEKIVDPIMHILRNSIDHGIESPEIRKQKGKPEHGTIILKAYPSGAHVVIEISDDGAGINLDKVHKTAVRKGVISNKDALSNDEMLKLILSPGFSTTENISEVSGRGVGMDVVSQKIMEIRGELDIQTKKDIGTTITIKLPLTISIIDSLLVMLGGTYYLIPLSVVERCAEIPLELISNSSTEYINLDGKYMPFIDLHNEFNVSEERSEIQRLILVNHKDIVVALVVDQIMGNHQAVLKSLGHIYRRQEIISGASILGNGEVALVLDTNRLIMDYMVSKQNELEKINKLNMKAVGKS